MSSSWVVKQFEAMGSGVWTPLEIKTLKKCVEKYPPFKIDWGWVSAKVSDVGTNRSKSDCLTRWKEYDGPTVTEVMWTTDEEIMLLESFKVWGLSQFQTVISDFNQKRAKPFGKEHHLEPRTLLQIQRRLNLLLEGCQNVDEKLKSLSDLNEKTEVMSSSNHGECEADFSTTGPSDSSGANRGPGLSSKNSLRKRSRRKKVRMPIETSEGVNKRQRKRLEL